MIIRMIETNIMWKIKLRLAHIIYVFLYVKPPVLGVIKII